MDAGHDLGIGAGIPAPSRIAEAAMAEIGAVADFGGFGLSLAGRGASSADGLGRRRIAAGRASGRLVRAVRERGLGFERGCMAVVEPVVSLGRSGVGNWLLQRLSALILLAYAIWMMTFILTRPEADHAQWQALFASFEARLFSSAALLALCVHGWIGLWMVCTDYLSSRLMPINGNWLRGLALLAGAVALLLYLAYGLRVVWSV